MNAKVSKTQAVTVHLPRSLLARYTELEDFLGHRERTIWIRGVETNSRAEMIHQIVRNFCAGGWGDWDPGILPEDENNTASLTLKLSKLEVLQWKDWVKSGYAATCSELARKAIALYLQWSDYQRWRSQQLYNQILLLGTSGDLQGIRRLTSSEPRNN